MTSEDLFLVAFFAMPPISAFLGLYWGYTFAIKRYYIGDLNKYLKAKFPDVWTAYKRGVDEGYAQGLRDGQEQTP